MLQIFWIPAAVYPANARVGMTISLVFLMKNPNPIIQDRYKAVFCVDKGDEKGYNNQRDSGFVNFVDEKA